MQAGVNNKHKNSLQPRFGGAAAMLLACLLALHCTMAAATEHATGNADQWRWRGVGRIVVVADIHGAFVELTELLKATGMIDASLHWSGADAHLVSLGDLLDRGPQSRKVMDLLMRLQTEARADGGYVHVLAGNHEIMNLMGDVRYVSPAEFAAFADDEPAAAREQAYEDFLARRSEAIAQRFLRGGASTGTRYRSPKKEFAERYPPGYFGHQHAFTHAGRYGRWLLSLPAIIVINETVFVHGGLPAVTAREGLNTLNRRFHADLRRYLQLWKQLIAAGVLSASSAEKTRMHAIQALRIADPGSCTRDERNACRRERGAATDAQRTLNPETVAALKEFIDLVDSSFSLLGPNGPLWYRGSVRCKSFLETPILEAALSNLGAERVVVGHTPTTDRRVNSIREQRLIMLDTGMLVSRYNGRPAALLIDDGETRVQYLNPQEITEPQRDGGNGVYPLSDQQLRQALKSGAIDKISKGFFGRLWRVRLKHQGATVDAIFYPDDSNDTAKRELAAYTLDRMLGFGMVAPTVARRIKGKRGALQLSYPDVITEAARRRQGIAAGDWCPIEPQLALIAVFDRLIDIRERANSTILYDTQLWTLHAIEHGSAFSKAHTLAALDHRFTPALAPVVQQALQGLNRKTLAKALGRWLTKAQIAALLARRDALLANSQTVQIP